MKGGVSQQEPHDLSVVVVGGVVKGRAFVVRLNPIYIKAGMVEQQGLDLLNLAVKAGTNQIPFHLVT